MRFAFIAAEKASYPVRVLCRTLAVSRAGFYAWHTRPPARPDPAGSAARRRDSGDSRRDPPALWQSAGARRAPGARAAGGPQAGRPLDARARALRPPAAPVSDHDRLQSSPGRWPPTCWPGSSPSPRPTRRGSPTSRISGPQEGWLYLAVILDLFSRAVVGWALSARITRHLTLQALTMALGRRRPPQGLLHHSDRGSQYASADYRRALRAHGIVCSMSRRGNCWDNAVAESFFATLKVELAHEADWATRGQARGEVFEYIEQFYNGQRRHSALGYLSPLTFERRWATEGGTTAMAASPAIAGGSPETTRSVEAPGSTRTRGAAISVSPPAPSVTPISSIPGILEAAPRTPVGTRARVSPPLNRRVYETGAEPVGECRYLEDQLRRPSEDDEEGRPDHGQPWPEGQRPRAEVARGLTQRVPRPAGRRV